jgi:hypothetical protein
VYRPREPFFALAGEEDGKRVFLGADRESKPGSHKTKLRLTEYQDLRKVQSFTFTVMAFDPVLRQAELDATGRYWILVVELPPPDMAPGLGWKYATFLVSRNGSRWREIGARSERGTYFLETFSHRDDSILVFRKSAHPPEMRFYRFVER